MLIATTSLELNMTPTLDAFIAWLNLHAVNIIVIILAAWLVRTFGARILSRLVARTVRPDMYPSKIDRTRRVKTLQTITTAVVKTGVYIIAGIMIIGEINPNYATALFASAGLLTVALGFSARDIINDFVRGLFIISENQYRVGDTVSIANVTGVVERITIRTTILRDSEGSRHHIPNGAISVATNSTIGYSKINEDIIFPLTTDTARVAHIIAHIGEKLSADPIYSKQIQTAPFVSAYKGYAQEGIVLSISATTTANDKEAVQSQFYKLLLPALAKQNIAPIGSIATPSTPPPK